MKLFNTAVIFCMALSVTAVSFSAAAKTTSKSSSKSKAAPVISAYDAAKYVNKNVTVDSIVMEIEHSGDKSLIELENYFMVVVDKKSKQELAKSGIDVESLSGASVKVTGKLYKDKKKSIQMDLTKASQIVVTKPVEKKSETTTTRSTTRSSSSQSSANEVVVPFSGVITVAEVTAHINQTGTVEGKVVDARKSTRSNTYFLDFASQQKVFTVVVFTGAADQFAKDSVDILSFKGKSVQVTGKIVSPGTYGPEIILNNAGSVKDFKIVNK